LPGAPLLREVMQSERELGGGLIAGGVAFRVFLWLVPFGLVVAAALSFWSEHDPDGLESAARRFGVGAAAAQAASEALQHGDRSALLALLFGLTFLAWSSLGALRALVLSYALAWQLKPPRIRRPLRAIALFNGLFLLAILSSAGVAWLREQMGTTAILSTAVTLTLTTAIALCAMWLLPHRATHPRELLPGAALVAVGDQLIHIAVLFYFAPKLGDSEETYGAFGTAATMLVWIYILSRLVTGAAFLNATLWTQRHQPHHPHAVHLPGRRPLGSTSLGARGRPVSTAADVRSRLRTTTSGGLGTRLCG
jgi:membrane protein